ncbi:MAG: hypothetical protein COB88_03025 [Flavobacteriales bacterium]|nr:MAG: hypothetical protein COB88_03025 [Flavobacteriales bacterium]
MTERQPVTEVLTMFINSVDTMLISTAKKIWSLSNSDIHLFHQVRDKRDHDEKQGSLLPRNLK